MGFTTYFWPASLSLCLIISLESSARTNNSIIGRQPHPPQDTLSSRAINSKPWKEQDDFANSPFAHWTIWDRPGDQLAMEGGVGTPTSGNRRTRNKQLNGTDRVSTSHHLQFPLTSNPGNSDTPLQRGGGCNGNVQVGFYPVILVLIAAAAGLITIAIVWAIARKWTDLGSSGHGSGGYGSGGSGSSSGWSRQFDDSGFARVLKNLDFDQLTTLVTNGIDTYRKYVEKS